MVFEHILRSPLDTAALKRSALGCEARAGRRDRIHCVKTISSLSAPFSGLAAPSQPPPAGGRG